MTKEEIKELIYGKKNLKNKQELINLLRSKKSLLFIGSGVSTEVGYPGWYDIIDKLEHEAIECDKSFQTNDIEKNDYPLEYAYKIKQHINKYDRSLNRYWKILHDEFNEHKDPSKFHENLISLPCKGFITTNYDTLIERVLRNIEKENKEISFLLNKPGDFTDYYNTIKEESKYRSVLHIHGKYNLPKEIVLSRDEYDRAYLSLNDRFLNIVEILNKQIEKTYINKVLWKLFTSNEIKKMLKKNENIDSDIEDQLWTYRSRIVWSLFALHRFTFIGFGMKDPFFNKMLDLVCRDLWSWNEPKHYAIMPIDTEREPDIEYKGKAEKLKRNSGIEVIWYEVIHKSHLKLNELIEELNLKCGEMKVIDVPPEKPTNKEGAYEN